MGEARRRGPVEVRMLEARVRELEQHQSREALHRLGFRAPHRPQRAALAVAIALSMLVGIER